MTASDNEEDQTIVINDLLSFCWCKFKLHSKKSLEQSIKSFYANEEITEALETLKTALGLPVKGHKKKSLKENEASVILDLFSNNSNEELPIFVCKDLNNIPNLNPVKEKYKEPTPINTSKDDFMKKHNELKSELQELFSSLHEIKRQYESVVGDTVDLGDVEKNIEKLGISEKKPVVKDLNYLQTLIDLEENDEPVVSLYY